MPFFLKPVLAVRLRRATGQLLPPRAEVEAWFHGHDGAAPFEGLDHQEQAGGRPAAYWIARLRKSQEEPP